MSRKGKSLADAGPDFTYPQLRELKTISDALAPCIICVRIRRTRPNFPAAVQPFAQVHLASLRELGNRLTSLRVLANFRALNFST